MGGPPYTATALATVIMPRIPAEITRCARRPSRCVVGNAAPARQQSTNAATSALYAGPKRSTNSGPGFGSAPMENGATGKFGVDWTFAIRENVNEVAANGYQGFVTFGDGR